VANEKAKGGGGVAGQLKALPPWVETLAAAGGDYPRVRVIGGRLVPYVIDGRPVLTETEYRLWWLIAEGEEIPQRVMTYPLWLGLMYFHFGSEEGHFLPYVIK